MTYADIIAIAVLMGLLDASAGLRERDEEGAVRGGPLAETLMVVNGLGTRVDSC
jgi:hypothetical protein